MCVPLSCCLACCRGFMELAEACDVVRLWHAWPLARFVLLSTCVPTPRREERISDPLLWACPNPWRHQCGRARVRGQTVATPVKARGAQGSGRRPAAGPVADRALGQPAEENVCRHAPWTGLVVLPCVALACWRGGLFLPPLLSALFLVGWLVASCM